MPHAVMLFAAGYGTRMGSLTRDRPKPLIEVAGKPLIDHALAMAEEVEPERIVINTHYKAEMIEAHLTSRDVILSHETPKALETGGGLKAALPLLGQGPVFTMNTDAIWAGPNPLRHLVEAWRPDQMDALLICVPLGRAEGRTGLGDFSLDGENRVTRGGPFVYGGAQIIKTEGLSDIDQEVFSLNLLWDRMGQDARLFGVPYPGRWCDVGTPEGIAVAEDVLANADV